MYQVRVYVNYKSSVLNPQAEVVEGAIKRLGHQGVSDLKMGKFFDFKIEAETQSEAKKVVEKICDTLLANVNMETYLYELMEVN